MMFDHSFRQDNDYAFIDRRIDINILSEDISIGPRKGGVESFSDLFEKNLEWNDRIHTNPMGYRSMPFTEKHDGLHLLFSGCSNTVGEGLFFHETWSHKVFAEISKTAKPSGFYNLSLGGIGFVTIIANIFKYFRKYGNPDAIFINFPDLLRFYSYDKKTNQYFYSSKIEHDFNNMEKELENSVYSLKLLLYHYYLMLETYCKTNNIKLISFTWDLEKRKNVPSTLELFQEFGFKSFMPIDEDDLVEDISDYTLSHPEEKEFAIFSRDGQHSGIAINDFWSKKVFQKYLSLVKNV
jgi:hypothetical protein